MDLERYLASRARLVERELAVAGFREVKVEAVAVQRHFASLDEAMEAVTALAEMLGEAYAAEREPVESEIRKRYMAYLQPDGSCHMPGEAWLASATR